MKKCAYCDGNKKLTREHVFPDWVIKRQPENDARFTMRANRVTQNVPTIKDVCITCNNEVLSVLDKYAAELYDKHFDKIIPRNGQVKYSDTIRLP